MGTVFNKSADTFATVLEGLRTENVSVIVTVGESGDPALLGPQPDNVHVERYIPQPLLLPHCDLLISHAGSGATVGALAAGVPMLAIPQGADQFFNAEAIVRVGAGLRLLPSEFTAAAIRRRHPRAAVGPTVRGCRTRRAGRDPRDADAGIGRAGAGSAGTGRRRVKAPRCYRARK